MSFLLCRLKVYIYKSAKYESGELANETVETGRSI